MPYEEYDVHLVRRAVQRGRSLHRSDVKRFAGEFFACVGLGAFLIVMGVIVSIAAWGIYVTARQSLVLRDVLAGLAVMLGLVLPCAAVGWAARKYQRRSRS